MNREVTQLVEIVVNVGSELFKLPNLSPNNLSNEKPAKIFYLNYKYKSRNSL